MTLAEELQATLTPAVEPDLARIRARAERQRRRQQWGQSALVGMALVGVAGALFLALREQGRVDILVAPAPPGATSPEAVDPLDVPPPSVHEVAFGSETAGAAFGLVDVGFVGSADATEELRALVVNHGLRPISVVAVTLRRYDGSAWTELSGPLEIAPVGIPSMTRTEVLASTDLPALAPGWYEVGVTAEHGPDERVELGLPILLQEDGSLRWALLPDVEGARSVEDLALVPVGTAMEVANAGPAEAMVTRAALARWDGVEWRDAPPARDLAQLVPAGSTTTMPVDTQAWDLWLADPFISSIAGTPPGWYRMTVSLQRADGTTVELTALVHLAWSLTLGGPSAEPRPTAACMPEPAADHAVYVVQAGDTLDAIAERIYGDGRYFPVLAGANCVSASNPLQIGQTLVVPPRPAEPTPSPAATPIARCQVVLLGDPDRYLVQPGDTLASIAVQLYGDAAQASLLAQANCLDSAAPLPDGAELRVPQLPGDMATARYVVQDGDTLAGIALAAYGDEHWWTWVRDVNAISETNPLVTGKELAIPPPPATPPPE